jgi:hypothetical protein
VHRRQSTRQRQRGPHLGATAPRSSTSRNAGPALVEKEASNIRRTTKTFDTNWQRLYLHVPHFFRALRLNAAPKHKPRDGERQLVRTLCAVRLASHSCRIEQPEVPEVYAKMVSVYRAQTKVVPNKT